MLLVVRVLEMVGPVVEVAGLGWVGHRGRLWLVHGVAEVLLRGEEAILRKDGRVHALLKGKIGRDGRGSLHV